MAQARATQRRTVDHQQALQVVQRQPVAPDKLAGQHQRERMVGERGGDEQQLGAQPARILDPGVQRQRIDRRRVVQGVQGHHAFGIVGAGWSGSRRSSGISSATSTFGVRRVICSIMGSAGAALSMISRV